MYPGIEQALLIPGWMNEDELNWLAEKARGSRLIVEIGAWCGRSTTVLMANCPGTVLVVDPWNQEIDGQRGTWAWTHFRANMQHYSLLEDAKAEIVYGLLVLKHKSTVAAKILQKRFPNAHPDMVFIDGDHTRVAADIRTWQPLLAPGGLLAGHDMALPAVGAALNKALGVGRYQHEVGQIWSMRP